jgi:DNA-binding IclR family transcriptional regulator
VSVRGTRRAAEARAAGLEASGGAKALIKGLELLREVAGRPRGVTLTELAAAAGMPKPTVHRLLTVLTETGMVRALPDGGYAPGPFGLALATAFLESVEVRAEAQTAMERLVRESQETVALGILDGTQVVYIDKKDAPQAVRMHSRVGKVNPAHSSAIGKAMLAFSPPETVAAVITQGLVARTPNTITDPDRFRQALAEVRERGYAVDHMENEDGIRCVGAPVLDHRGQPVAGLSVAGPSYRVTPEQVPTLAALVCQAAEEVSRRLGHDRTQPPSPLAPMG